MQLQTFPLGEHSMDQADWNITRVVHSHCAMESVILTVSNRDTQAEAKGGIKEELEASPFTDGIRFSTRPRTLAGI